jgi:hypothetical protein
MGPNSSLHLVKPRRTRGVKRRFFRTGESIPDCGIYRVVHRRHRLPHEVTLLRNEQFPRCSKCQHAVTFELLRAVAFTQEARESSPQIRLYELPVFDDEPEEQDIAS